MKRLIILVATIMLFAVPAFAVEGSWSATPVTAVMGRMGATKAYTFSADSAVTMATMYVTGWSETSTGLSPIGALVTVETNDARFSCGGGTPTTSGLGHVLASGSSFMFSMAAGETCKFINKTAGSNALVQITPIYSK